MPQRKSKIILSYFLLLFLVGTISNINFNNIKFQKIKNIKVTGLDDNENLILLEQIKNLKLHNIFFIDEKEITNQINSNSLVEKFEIFKKYPSSLDINLEKTKLLAKINYEEKIFLIGSNGKLSKDNSSNNHLPFIFGKPDINEFLNFKKIIDRSKFSYYKIKNLYFYPSKRWDIELDDNTIIKLSKNYSEESLKLIFNFLYNQNLENIRIVDARIENQIILND